jgi:hypothetical protein
MPPRHNVPSSCWRLEIKTLLDSSSIHSRMEDFLVKLCSNPKAGLLLDCTPWENTTMRLRNRDLIMVITPPHFCTALTFHLMKVRHPSSSPRQKVNRV